MSLQIGSMLATTSQASLLVGPQMAIPSEEFAVLMNVGAAPQKSDKAVENPLAIEAKETTTAAKPEEITETIDEATRPAVNQADALVLALSSDARLPEILDNFRKAFNDKPAENELAYVPIIASADKPVIAPAPVRRAPVERLAISRREPAPDLPSMSANILEDETESHEETDARRDEVSTEELFARPLVAVPNTQDFATTPVLPAQAPVKEPSVARDYKTIEAPNSPVRVDAMQQGALTVPLKNDDFQMEIETEATNSNSDVARVEEQGRETPLPISTAAKPLAAITKPVLDRISLLEATSSIIAVSEDHIALGTATKSVLRPNPDAAETRPETANTVENSVPVQFARDFSNLPIAPSPKTAIVDTSTTTIDTVVDRQLDLVRNERWLGELAQDIASTSDSKDRLSFRLLPHQLGRLDVEVSRSQSGLSLAFRTESDGAQSILSAAQSRLADELRSQGVRLADTPMFSSDTRHFQHNGAAARPAPLIESFITPTDMTDAPEQVQRDGRYA